MIKQFKRRSKMLIQNLMNCFHSSGDYGSRGKVNVSPSQEAKETQQEAQLSGVDKEVNMLIRHFGALQNGQQIELSLHELLTIVPHKRKRSDSYAKLIRTLKERYAVDLVITPNRKSHEGEV